MELIILILFIFFMGFIFTYSLAQANLVFKYIRQKRRGKEAAPELPDIVPMVTVQLPVYNELYVIDRLIDKVCEFDYPKDRLEIQVLDDSDDETVQLIADRVELWREKGIDITHVRRPERVGFKAGALEYGTNICKGEFIAIFDADFAPEKDFLLKTIPGFDDDKVGVVQTRWAYVNEDYSMLTRLQAFALNGHFRVEQVGRNAGGHFINFNGTAGVWRKECIKDAGGWQSDTLTEDLDLSYRAQLKGWKFKYLEEVGAPSELPAEINALKGQQFRWTKGAAECTVKNLPKVINAKEVSFGTKFHAIFHLMNSFIFISVFMLAILSLPLVFVKANYQEYHYLFQLSSVFMVSWIILALFYWVAFSFDQKEKEKRVVRFLFKFPLFLSVSMGMSLHNAIAVMEGYLGRKSPFIRTPKFNINEKTDRWENNKYTIKKVGALTYIEGLLFIYFLIGIGISFYYFDLGILPLLLLLAFGYGFVFFSSIFHVNRSVNTTE